MPRSPRVDVANMVYHVINRANNRMRIFESDADYKVFEKILEDAVLVRDIKIISYCIMPNHWHIIFQTTRDGQLSEVLQWVTTTHATRWNTFRNNLGGGHLYQGRYKSFTVETNNYLLELIRYVERNPVRASLVPRAEDWKYSSHFRRKNKLDHWLSDTIIELPKNYTEWVNEKEKDIGEMRCSVNKGKPLGSEGWVTNIIKKFGLEVTVREKGRPPKKNIIP